MEDYQLYAQRARLMTSIHALRSAAGKSCLVTEYMCTYIYVNVFECSHFYTQASRVRLRKTLDGTAWLAHWAARDWRLSRGQKAKRKRERCKMKRSRKAKRVGTEREAQRKLLRHLWQGRT